MELHDVGGVRIKDRRVASGDPLIDCDVIDMYLGPCWIQFYIFCYSKTPIRIKTIIFNMALTGNQVCPHEPGQDHRALLKA